MPRKDRTFTDKDLIRVYQNHLKRSERKEVDKFFFGRQLQTGGSMVALSGIIVKTLLEILKRNPLSLHPFTERKIREITERIVRHVKDNLCPSLEERVHGENQTDR